MVFYFVQRGETLFAIAKRYQTTVYAIVAANRLEDPNAICPGQALIIPKPGEVPSPPPGGIVHLMRPGETVFHLSRRFGAPVSDILRANQIAHPEFILPGQQLVIPERAEARDDWPMLGRTPGRSGTTAVSLAGLPVEAWSHSPRRHVGLRPSAPVIRYDRVYVGLSDGQYYAFDRHTGAVKWRVSSCRRPVGGDLAGFEMATPAVHDGLVYLCGPDGVIRAVDAHTGKAIWQVALGAAVTGAPAIADGVLYVGAWDHRLYALECKTGAIAWRAELDGRLLHPVAVGDDQVYAVTEAGTLWALEESSGYPCWQAEAEADLPPVFAEVLLIAGGQAFDPRTGEVLWRVDAPTSPTVWIDQVIYPGMRVDLFSGEVLCAAPDLVRAVRSHLLAGDLHLLVTDEQRLEGREAITGSERWGVRLEANGVLSPAVTTGMVALTLEDGSVVAYRMEPDTAEG